MTGDPSVISALNAVLALEITVFEVTHAFEHVMRRKKYRWFRDWFDNVVGKSRDRRRWVTDRIFQLDGMAEITMTAAAVDPAAKVDTFISQTLAMATQLLAGYQAAYVTAESAGDNATAYGLCDAQRAVEKLVGCLEAFEAQMTDLGIPLFIQDKIRS